MSPPENPTALYYEGRPEKQKPEAWRDLPALNLAPMSDPWGYLSDPGLVDAVNVALALGQPLLLTGEPGTGKTQLAYSVAYELGFLDDKGQAEVLKFETKSSTESRDLFYTFDTLARFRAARHEDEMDPVNFIAYHALGLAVLRANRPEEVTAFLPPGASHTRQRRSVVLIDEIDKAPRDVPNDILNEIEAMYFRIPEMGNQQLAAEPGFRPVVFITSNSEKALPDAFLRRCIFYNIPFPDKTRLREIVARRITEQDLGEGRFLADALEFFEFVRNPDRGVRKRPGTAELLNWVSIMVKRGADPTHALKAKLAPGADDPMQTCRNTLFKLADDQELAGGLIGEWRTGP